MFYIYFYVYNIIYMVLTGGRYYLHLVDCGLFKTCLIPFMQLILFSLPCVIYGTAASR